MILNDRQIRELCLLHGMISPYTDGDTTEYVTPINGFMPPIPPPDARKVPGKISYGLSSYGYDLRPSRRWKVFTNSFGNVVVDPKAFDPKAFVDIDSDVCVIPPNSFCLAESVEIFQIPRDLLVICLGKSTYCRCGLAVNLSPLEPEWKGRLTIELSNQTPLPIKVYANEGVGQLLFFRGEPCLTSYADKKGVYQNQSEITLSRIRGQ